MPAVMGMHREVDQRSRALGFVPRSTRVGAYQQPIVRDVIAVHALTGGAEHVEVGLTEKRDRFPALAAVGGLDEPEKRRQILLEVRMPRAEEAVCPGDGEAMVSCWLSPTRTDFASPSAER
jgi:hypothetical protein